MNLFRATDGYKIGHWRQLLSGTQYSYGYGMPRHKTASTVVWGMNEIAQKLSVSCRPYYIKEFEDLVAEGYGPSYNKEGFDLLSKVYGEDTQELPILFRGLEDGTVVAPGTPHYTLVNTDPRFPWLPGILESVILRDAWYGSTVATISYECRQIILDALRLSGTPEDIDYKLVDFGLRGVSSGESSALGGAGHGISFRSSDNTEALSYIKENYYDHQAFVTLNASEHSTVTQGGREGEKAFYKRFIKTELRPGVSAACVSDSYDIWEALKMWKSLEPDIKQSGGTLIVRPDSGDPVTTPVEVVQQLIVLFGSTVNDKGYMVLPDHIRVIQGDGVNTGSIEDILDLLHFNNISSDNISFGMGGELLQKGDRDRYKWSYKCSSTCVDGIWSDVYKDPIDSTKRSLRGLVTDGDKHDEDQALRHEPATKSHFVTHYNGELGYLRSPDQWEVIRARSLVSL